MKKYLCVKDYHPIIHKRNGNTEPTDKPIVIKDDILIQMGENDSRYKSSKNQDLALYEYILIEYNDCFKLIKH